ncbi:unnamed protein product, partial [Effrenium voratum]
LPRTRSSLASSARSRAAGPTPRFPFRRPWPSLWCCAACAERGAEASARTAPAQWRRSWPTGPRASP